MARTQGVLRLKRTDQKSEHLLLNITQDGPHDLDLKLIATDREDLFHGSIKESKVKSLQAPNFTGDLEQWKTTLSFALLHRSPNGPQPDFLQGVETVASISGTTVTITFRKNIDGITQRLGTVTLKQNNDEEVQVFDWVDCAVATSDDLRGQLEALQDSATSQQDQIAKLTKDLDDLVKAKKQHEDEMLTKFAALLNAKKLKIRDQQRLLNGAHIDPDTAEEATEARASSSKTSRRAGASRAGKRKANGSKEPAQDLHQDEEDDAPTDASENEEEDQGRIQQETPETDDGEATADGSHDDVNASKISNGFQTTRHAAKRKQSTTAETMDVDESVALPQRGKDREMAEEPTPQPQAPAMNAADDDDETDDEL